MCLEGRDEGAPLEGHLPGQRESHRSGSTPVQGQQLTDWWSGSLERTRLETYRQKGLGKGFVGELARMRRSVKLSVACTHAH